MTKNKKHGHDNLLSLAASVRGAIPRKRNRDEAARENMKQRIENTQEQVMIALEKIMHRPMRSNDILLRPRFHSVSAANPYDVKCTVVISFPGLYMQHHLLGDLEIEGSLCATEDEAKLSAVERALGRLRNADVEGHEEKKHTVHTLDVPLQTEIQEFYDAKLNELQTKQTTENASHVANEIVSYALLQSKKTKRERVDSLSGLQPLSSSDCSKVSLISGCDCFLADALFKTLHSDRVMFVRAADLEVGSTVLAASGKLVRVQALQSSKGERDLVSIYTENATLKVTSNHRVMVQRRIGQQSLLARDLREGDQVLVGPHSNIETIDQVVHETILAQTITITFFPDEPVEAFPPPCQAILSKGHGAGTRRSQPRAMAKAFQDNASIPDTEYSWEQHSDLNASDDFRTYSAVS